MSPRPEPLTSPQPPFDPELCQSEPDYFTEDCRPIAPGDGNDNNRNNNNNNGGGGICAIKPTLHECRGVDPINPGSEPHPSSGYEPYDPCGPRGSDLACAKYMYDVFSLPARIILCGPIPFVCP